MKIGDKYVCINQYFIGYGDIGNVYSITDIRDTGVSPGTRSQKIIRFDGIENDIFIIENGRYTDFNEYFLPLSEYREQRINEILDEY